MANRFTVLIGIVFLAYAALGFHVFELQITKGDYYLAKAESQMLASQSTNGNRGAISFVDKDGKFLPAAVMQAFPLIYAVPKKIVDVQEAANLVAPILGKSPEALIKIFSKTTSQYELLARKADPAVAQQITDLNVKGVYAGFAQSRLYPLGPVASQLLGYVGPDTDQLSESGKYGVEKFYNSTLASGEGVVLTIDPNIQIAAEKILNDVVAKYHAAGGSIIVADPKTGAILAMAGNPSFDPNVYSASPVATFRNPMVQGIYEPGSIFKVFTMAAGIDSGKVTTNTTYDDKGSLTSNGYTITNYDLKTHGPYGPGTTMTEIIEHSINTGAAFVESKIGNDLFTAYMKKFLLDQKTGIDLPGEVGGNLNPLNPKSRQVVFYTASYGQGVAVTSVELLAAMGSFANDGKIMRPYVNAALAPKEIGQPISAESARIVTDMMVSAVDTAKIAAINGYSVAGKTGSAYMPDLVHGGYKDRLIDSYVGFAPASDPRFIALIRVDDLPEDAIAGLIVVPAFRELAQYIINYYNIPPDRL